MWKVKKKLVVIMHYNLHVIYYHPMTVVFHYNFIMYIFLVGIFFINVKIPNSFSLNHILKYTGGIWHVVT